MRYLLFALLLYSRFALAGDAAHCIQFGSVKDGQTMKNVCAEEVYVFWCNDRNAKGAWGTTLCNTTDSTKGFYVLSRYLKSGEIENNPMSLPANALITYGACFGGRNQFVSTDFLGGYFCKTSSSAMSPSASSIITTSGASPEEACQRGLLMSPPSGVGSCDCTEHGSRYICKTASYGEMPPDSVIGRVKKMVRDKLEEMCKADPKCKPVIHNGGAGRRG
jgi:hypothetical protein